MTYIKNDTVQNPQFGINQQKRKWREGKSHGWPNKVHSMMDFTDIHVRIDPTEIDLIEASFQGGRY
jgi:hypothetical protein